MALTFWSSASPARGPHALELLGDIRHRSFYAHALALPVTTEIARVRGVYGYQLPKWRGPVSGLLGGLGVSTILRLDVVKGAQLVLNMPTRLKTFDPAPR